MTDGTLLRGEVLARWQEFVGTGELLARSRPASAGCATGSPRHQGQPAARAATSARRCRPASRRWSPRRRRPRPRPRSAGGGSCPAARRWSTAPPRAGQASPDLPARVERLVRDWQGDVLDLVREEGKDRRTTARVLSFGVNGIGVVLMLAAFSQTMGLSGAEIGIAGGSAVLAQRLLEGVFGDQAVRELADQGTARAAAPGRRAVCRGAGPVRRGARGGGGGPGAGARSFARRGGSGGDAMSPLRMGSQAAVGRVGRRHPSPWRCPGRGARSGRRELDPALAAQARRVVDADRRADLDRRRPHRRRARRRHREREVQPVQRPGRCRRRDGRRPPPDDLDPDGGRVGRRTPRPSCSTGSRSARGTTSTRATRAARGWAWTAWCCWTCPTSTRGRWSTASRPTGCSSWSTCSSG